METKNRKQNLKFTTQQNKGINKKIELHWRLKCTIGLRLHMLPRTRMPLAHIVDLCTMIFTAYSSQPRKLRI